MYRWLLFFALTVCAKTPIDTRGVDTPRGWTIDKSSGDVTAAKAFDQGKTLKIDSFDSEEGITTEAVMSANDSIANIKTNEEKLKKLIEINVALRNALTERQDKTGFIRNYIERLEVHVHTRISPLRVYDPQDNNDTKWPRIAVDVDLGDEVIGDSSNNNAKVIDGGTLVFSREYKANEKNEFVYTINHIQKIEIKLVNNETLFGEYENPRGRKICAKQRLGGLLGCKKHYQLEDKYLEEANKVIVDKVEVFVNLVGHNRSYKIFAEESKIELSSAMRQYKFVGLKQNPHWLLHAYSSVSDGWQGDHDGSEFAKKIWGIIEDDGKVTTDVFWEVFQCSNQGLLPISVTPENPSPDSDDGDKWATANAPFAPHTEKDQCQPITAESIANNAPPVDDTCNPLDIPDDLSGLSEEKLEELRSRLQNLVNRGEESNANLKEAIDDLSKTGCFYDRKLTGGITVGVEWQILINAAGKYMTVEKFKEQYPVESSSLGGPPKMLLYINLGLDKRSYPLGNFYSNTDADEERLIVKNYTENFTMRDLTFVHLSLGGDPTDRIKKAEVEREYQKSITSSPWFFLDPLLLVVGIARNPQQKNRVKSLNIEYVVNLLSIALYRGGVDPKNLFYEHKVENATDDPKTRVKSGLSILNSVVNSWSDYNLKSNQKWKDRRQDDCSD